MITHNDTSKPFWIVQAGSDVHYGKLEEGQQVTSVYIIRSFESEQELIDELVLLGIEYEDQDNISQVGE